MVRCPQCGKPCEYSETNSFRPFCSERCKLIDLGDWASEKFKIPDSQSSSNTLNEEDSNEDDSDLSPPYN